MKKIRKTSEITRELMDQEQNLRSLTGQVSELRTYITEIADKLSQNLEIFEKVSSDPSFIEPGLIEIYNEKTIRGNSSLSSAFSSMEFSRQGFTKTFNGPSKIIPFPGSGLFTNNSGMGVSRTSQRQRSLPSPILAMPGEPLVESINDYRPHLQRDGLILLAWDMRLTEKGERYTAYWVTSTGICRYYASKLLSSESFSFAKPDHKSYAAEDGIEFYGQLAPDYLIHVAPELMMSNPRHSELRLAHIDKLKFLGSNVNFDYKFLLKTQKERNLPLKKTNRKENDQAGA